VKRDMRSKDEENPAVRGTARERTARWGDAPDQYTRSADQT